MASRTSTAPSRDVQTSEWRARNNKTLRGFFTVTLPSGLVIHDCMLHEKGDDRWISLPAREYEQNGARKWAQIITFTDKAAEQRFRDQVLAALDRDEPWKEEQGAQR